MNWFELVILALILWNIIVFAIYGLDKRKAKYGGWRISEKALLLSAAFMGGAGALLGMHAFRHKTKHARFRIVVPLLLLLNVAVAVGLIILLDDLPRAPYYR